MSEPSFSPEQDLDILLGKLIDDQLTTEEHASLESVLNGSLEARVRYYRYIDNHLALQRLHEDPDQEALDRLADYAGRILRHRKRDRIRTSVAIAAACAVIVMIIVSQSLFQSVPAVDELTAVTTEQASTEQTSLPEDSRTAGQSGMNLSSATAEQVAKPSSVPSGPPARNSRASGPPVPPRLVQASGAEFFGQLLPPLKSPLVIGQRYSLQRGMIELLFPSGARAILEAPAMFEVNQSDRLDLRIGRCSVYTPKGAEGFQVVTPRSEVTDLGTRFTVNVDEEGTSELHVIEGAARVNPVGRPERSVTLKAGTARRVDESARLTDIKFDKTSYQAQLPDRVISYEAQRVGDGPEVRDLLSVTVQRGRQVYRYVPEEMIGIDVVSFVARANTNCVGWDGGYPENPASTLTSDVALNTGLFNFGGRRPSDVRRRKSSEKSRRGMGIRFLRPVVNEPGPDVVLFEVQSEVYPVDGDPFWVSPLTSFPGERSHLINRFDITMTSAEALPVASFKLRAFSDPPQSLDDLKSTDKIRFRQQTLPFHALAVGIDLSDLGYPPGAQVNGIFLETDESKSHQLDPVFIAGFPLIGSPPEQSEIE